MEFTPIPYVILAPNATLADYIQPLTQFAYPAVYHHPSARQPPAIMVTTNINYGKK